MLARTRWLLARRRAGEALEIAQLSLETQPPQNGAFAADIIGAAMIDALRSLGDPARAHAIVEAGTGAGVLTTLAGVRLALQESRFDAATAALHSVMSDRQLGPGPRAEAQLLAAWLDASRSDTIDGATATLVARLAERGHHRRLLATAPTRLIELVRARLDATEARAFTRTTAGLAHVEMQRRPTLTGGELRVLNALSAHATTADIAAAFHVSPNTIKSQLRSMYRKLGCSTRNEAIAIASRFHLIAFEVD
ncbi:MAG: response regulator transcription factor [Microbacterium sp.]|uniref:helix-turn-helix transcriptional regulator n=1 Tax=Microbacterium sp. TaxID=51671 RepID=UPI003A85B454